MKTKATIKPIKKMSIGGVSSDECASKPKKPGCRRKYSSKTKSQETKGSILGTIGAGVLGGLGYMGYKKLKEQKKGGATKKYQAGGMTKRKK